MGGDGAYWSRKFAELREIHRREDGSYWSGAALERATGGRVTASWVSKLSRGRYQDPGFSKIAAVSHAMGIPLDSWLPDSEEG